MKHLIILLAIVLSLTSYAQQGAGWWSPVSVPSTGDCGTYRVTRTLADQSWDVWVTYVDCHDVVHTVYLYPPEAMSIVVCASKIPVMTTNAPVISNPWGLFGNDFPSSVVWDGSTSLSGYSVGTFLSVLPADAPTTVQPTITERIIFEIHTQMPIGSTGADLPDYAFTRYYYAGLWNSLQNYTFSQNPITPYVVNYNSNMWYAKEEFMPEGVAPTVPSQFNPGTVEFLTDGCNPNFIPPGLPEDVDPEAPTIPCGGGVSYNGGRAFPSDIIYTVGSGTGNMLFSFNAMTAPDKFILIKADGVNAGDIIHDTGYRGAWHQQQALNEALASRGLLFELLTSPGSGSVNIPKTSDYTQVLVRVYAPLEGTAWDFSLSCP